MTDEEFRTIDALFFWEFWKLPEETRREYAAERRRREEENFRKLYERQGGKVFELKRDFPPSNEGRCVSAITHENECGTKFQRQGANKYE